MGWIYITLDKKLKALCTTNHIHSFIEGFLYQTHRCDPLGKFGELAQPLTFQLYIALMSYGVHVSRVKVMTL